MSQNVFLRSLPTQPGPWTVETVPHERHPREQRVYILDSQGEPVCEIPTANNRRVAQRARGTRAVIQHAPQLLAALIEYAFNAEQTGIPIRPELVDLIHRAGGPDLKEKL